tara:strand:- start:259 stop:774 length:516 start_codon:yes stop_codon:yes gene_type:complete
MKNSKGFTLVELGIVIGVMAVLATGVLLGHGFAQASKVTKAAQGVQHLKKATVNYVGRRGGEIDTKTVLSDLATRELIVLDRYNQMVLGNVAFKVKEMSLSETTDGAHLEITVATPTAQTLADLHAALHQDANYSSCSFAGSPVLVEDGGRPPNIGTGNMGEGRICFSALF